MCGDDGCGSVCGECPDETLCTDDTFLCKAVGTSCEGFCGEFSTGGDCHCDAACFGFDDCCPDVCSYCNAEEDFVEPCTPCVPDCEGKVCGDDGCDGLCGECAAGEECSNEGLCFDPTTIEGNLCSNAIPVGDLPWETSGDTGTASNTLAYGDGVCEGEDWGEGEDANDLIYELTTKVAGIYTISMVGFDAALYAVTDCESVDTSCLAAVESWGDSEELVLSLEADVTCYVVVDGYSTSMGEFDLAIDVCVPDCEGKVCGSDGCVGECGDCAEGEACDIDGTCVPAAQATGNTCEKPFEVDAVPYLFEGDTGNSTNNYSFGDEVCEGKDWGDGEEANDQVFHFTPEVDGTYTVAVEGYDSVLYVASDCGDIDGSCVAASDSAGTAETLELDLTADTSYYIFVDGWSADSQGAYTLSIETNQ